MRSIEIWRRRLLPLLAIAAVTAAAAGCGSSASSNNSSGGTGGSSIGAGGIPNGGTMTWPLYANPVSMTPLHGQESEGTAVEKSIFAGLVDYNPDTLDVVPAIATSWDHNSDNTVWTFHLKSGVKFQPGANGEDYGTVTAQTFVDDWGIACSKDIASEVSYILAPIAGFTQCTTSTNHVLSGVKALDDTTLQVTLSAPFADFPTTLGHPVSWAFPPELANTVAKEKAFEKHPVGAGPFQFVSWDPNKSVVIKRFDGYYGAKAHLDEVNFQIYPNGNDVNAFNAFKNGGGDYATIPTGQYRTTKADPQLGHDVVTGPELALYYYGFQLNGDNPLAKNIHLRKALAWATNSPAIVDNIREGVAKVADGLVPPGIPGFQPGMSPYHYDINQAKQELAASGVSNPSVTLSYNTDPSHQAIAEALAQGYKQAGFQVKLANYEWGTYLDKLSKGELEFWRLGWLADYPAMDNFLYPLFYSKEAGQNNSTFYNNPTVDKDLLAARAEPDATKRYADYNAVGKLIMQDVPEIPIYYYGRDSVVSPQVINYKYDAMGVPHFALMGIDTSKPHL